MNLIYNQCCVFDIAVLSCLGHVNIYQHSMFVHEWLLDIHQNHYFYTEKYFNILEEILPSWKVLLHAVIECETNLTSPSTG